MISKTQIHKIVQIIIKGYNPKKIILFGSYANGNPTEDSDLDMLLVKESKLPRYKRARKVHKLFDPYPCAMDIIVYNSNEIKKWKDVRNSFVYDVLKNGKVVYEQTC
ncbi:MAG: nucleotidyltransferase domain-containing protein [Candidatus Cloacimonetes bacterium]|nr:nucleotidyltransferase domain-containing protein [Candidatus Cloacimonadota bacterium]